ncbi:uncharacterized [Tachysurus ichikawai]
MVKVCSELKSNTMKRYRLFFLRRQSKYDGVCQSQRDEHGVVSSPSQTLELLRVRRLSNSFCLLGLKQVCLTQCVKKIRFCRATASRVGTTWNLGWNACSVRAARKSMSEAAHAITYLSASQCRRHGTEICGQRPREKCEHVYSKVSVHGDVYSKVSMEKVSMEKFGVKCLSMEQFTLKCPSMETFTLKCPSMETFTLKCPWRSLV